MIYEDIGEGSYEFGPAKVETMLLCHPGNCLGYAVTYKGHKVCYVTDNELFPEGSDMFSASYLERLTEFVGDADLLITDATYFDDEYKAKMGWGHAPIKPVCELAHQAGVKEMVLFHHDPDQNDEDLERKLKQCEHYLESSCTSAKLAEAEEEIQLVN